MSSPVLIVGGGLAGVAVAWQCWFRKVPFVVVDPGAPDTTSRIAAGLVTPITGQRLKVSWRLGTLLPTAHAFYQRVSLELDREFFHPSPMVRLFLNARELKFWEQRRHERDTQHWADMASPPPLVDPAVFHTDLGGFAQPDAAWLDTVAYLDASRAFFTSHGSWREGDVSDDSLQPSPAGVQWEDAGYQAAILCRGAAERHAPRFFPWLQWDCARGVLVDVRADFTEHRLVQRGGWLQPRGENRFRGGSTYEFDFDRSLDASVEEVRQKLQGLVKIPFEITGAQAGLRPIVKRQQLILGRHPVHEQILMLNGLGSKGVLRAPYFSAMLLDHFLHGHPIEAEVDVRANG